MASLTVSNSFWNAAAFLSSLLIKFFTTPLYFHQLGASGYGLLVLLISILSPLGLLDLGIGPATIKYVAESESVGDRRQSLNYVRSTLLFNLLVGVLGAFCIAAFAQPLVRSVFKIPEEDQAIAQLSLYWIGVRWLAIQVGNTFSGIPIAMRRYKLYSIGTLASSGAVDIIGLGVVYAGGNVAAITQVQAIIAIAVVGMWVMIGRWLLPGLSMLPNLHRDSFLKTFHFGFWQFISNIGTLFAHETERTLLGILISTTAVGFYNLALTLHSAVFLLIASLGQVLFPTFSHLHGLSRREQSGRIFVQALWALGILAVGLYVSLFAFAHDVLLLWVGSQVADTAYGVLRVIAVAGMAAALFIVPSTWLMGVGKTKWLAWESFLQGGITVVVSLILIPRFGLDGAAWGILLSILANVPFTYLIWRDFLREWIEGKSFLSMLLDLFATGVIMSLILATIRQAVVWQPTWLTLAVAYGLCSILTMGVAVLSDRLLPGSRARQRGTLEVVVRLVPWFGRFQTE